MASSRQQRWLILTSSTGSGHDMRAYALQEWAAREFGSDVRVEIYHALEAGSALGRFGVWLYNSIQRRCPWLHNIYWFVAELFGVLSRWGLGLAGASWGDKLREYRPHLIISVHDSLNRGYFGAARRMLGAASVRCVTYCGEWDGGFGFSRNWIDREADRIYVRIADVRAYVIARGYPAERTRVFCNLLHPRDFEPPLSASERARYRRQELRLEADRFTVFLATGALGADQHLGFLEAIYPLRDRLQAIVVCGRNRAAFEQVEQWRKAHPELRIAQEGFSRRMHRLMQASDCLVTRGGANTMAEALHYRCPILSHAHNGLMPQERCTRRFLLRHGVGEAIRGPAQLAAVLARWLDQPQAYAALRARLQAVACDDKPWNLVRELKALADEVQPDLRPVADPEMVSSR